MLKTILLFFFQFSTTVFAQKGINLFEQAINVGDYNHAFSILSEESFSPIEKAYCTSRFLTDLGARNAAILILDSVLEEEERNPTVTPILIYKMELVLLDALYEEAKIEAFAQQCANTEKFIHAYLSNDILAKATIQAYWSRYYARNMELFNSTQYAFKSLLLIKDLDQTSQSLIRVKALALNGLRNASLKEVDDQYFIQLRNNLYSEAKELSFLIQNKKTLFNLNDARNLIVLGMILQDKGAGIANEQSADEMLLCQEAHKNAGHAFKKAIKIAEGTIGLNNWITCNANIILGLLDTYKKDYKSGSAHFASALAASIIPSDSALLLNNDKRNLAVKLYSWMTYKYEYVPRDSLSFKDDLIPYFMKALDYYAVQQLISYHISEKWLMDGYSEHPYRDFFPFLTYFDGLSEKSVLQSRRYQAFLDYPGSKFKIIARIMGPRFLQQTEALIETDRCMKIAAEVNYLKSLNLWTTEFLPESFYLTASSDFSELKGYLAGNFFPGLKEIQNSLGQGNAYLEYSDLEHSEKKERFLLFILRDTILIEKVRNEELKKCFLESNDWKQNHYEAQATFFSISRELWFKADSILSSLDVNNIRICPNFLNSSLPFDALVNKKGQKAIDQFEISYVLDLGIEKLNRLLMKDDIHGFASFHPNYLQNPLPNSKRLSDALGLRFGDKLPEALSLNELKDAMQKNSVFHLGAHGSSLSGNGTDNFFFLGSKYADSTFIYLENERHSLIEFNDLVLNCNLIVVASCESGDGVMKLGEGKIDFTRTFLQAGAKGVITGLWKLDDYATSKILEHFYKNLENGESCVTALRNAKHTFLEEETDPVYQHPKYWAGIVYVGEDQQIRLKNNNQHWWWLLLLILPILFYVSKKSLL